MRALIIPAAAVAMALALPSLPASAVVTARPVVSPVLSVRGWGTNDDGELGSGSGATDVLAPVKVKIPASVTVTSIRAGCDHSVALTKTGALLAWGDNAFGQLGDGSFRRRNTPVSVKLPKGTKISAVRAGCEDTIALTKAGAVLAWGMGLGGTLGNGQTRNSATPVQVSLPKGTKVKAISAGCAHNLAVTTSGTLYAWGTNEFGQLGDGTHKNRHKPVLVKLPAGVSATGVTAGCSDSFALTNDGLFGWGVNAHGQLGTGDMKSHDAPVLIVFLFRGAGPGTITSVFAGCDDTYALFSKGGVLAWGSDDHGQLGDGGNSTQVKPVGVMLPTTVKVQAISAGCSNGYALSTAGQVFAWGFGGQGGLGDAGNSDGPVPVAVHNLTTLTVTAIGAGPAANHVFVIGVRH
jgi:alpha-tubulin suppressor-like RCC1 family protein